MTKVLIDKDVKNTVNFLKFKMIKSALKYSLDYHGLKEYKNRKNIYFPVKEELFNEQGIKCSGLCSHYVSKNKIKIYIQNSNPFKMVSSIFHEMTHAKQIIKNEISYTSYGRIWKGKEYIYNYYTGHESEYWDSPHEVDARKHQNLMMRGWICEILRIKKPKK